MAHLIDNSKGFNAFVSYGEPAWHGLGTIMQNALSTDDALKKGGLDFKVLKLPNIHILPTGEEIISDDSFFTLRDDVNKVLGSRLGKNYNVMQNQEALNICDEILQKGGVTIETAGAIDEGRKVFICLKINKSIVVKGKDMINQYLLICTSHDGTMSIVAKFTNVRVVCNNTLQMALSQGSGVKVRHTANASDRLKEAVRIMGLIDDNTAISTENYNKMAETIISTEQMFNYFGNVFLNDEEIKGLQSGKRIEEVASKIKQNTLAATLQFANTGIGQSVAMVGNDHTIWSAYNAVTGYVTRKKFQSVDDRANSLLFGGSNDTIQLATNLAINPSAVKPLKKVNFGNINFN
jgi:phage/plasmid-like protein (TIGR03299 family)